MSDTPRTDALLLEINEGRVYETVGPVTELACTLERELAEARRVISDGAKSSLDAAIRLADMSVQEIKLMAGEMTAGELRAVRAVVKGIVARLSALREAAK